MPAARVVSALLILVLAFRVYTVCKPDLIECSVALIAKREEARAGDNKLERFKNRLAERTYRYLPSPHSELLLGMTIGMDRLYEVPIFEEMLRTTGTIHVVVVSGYNITLVYNMLVGLLGSPYKKRNLVLGLAGTFIYSLLSGFDPPVVRAWLMGAVIAYGKYQGRRLVGLKVLMFTGIVLIIYNPLYLYSLSFQLSFFATLSLMLFEPFMLNRLKEHKGHFSFFVEDLSATLSAQILIWPLLSYKFGQVSLISPIVNTLILWTVPFATVVGGIFLLVSSIPLFAKGLSWVVFYPLDIFTYLVEVFAAFKWSILELRLHFALLVLYFLAVAFVYRKFLASNE